MLKLLNIGRIVARLGFLVLLVPALAVAESRPHTLMVDAQNVYSPHMARLSNGLRVEFGGTARHLTPDDQTSGLLPGNRLDLGLIKLLDAARYFLFPFLFRVRVQRIIQTVDQ